MTKSDEMVVEFMEADLLKLSLQAYTGEYTPKIMKLQGVYKNQLVQIWSIQAVPTTSWTPLWLPT